MTTLDSLTPRQREIAELVGRGWSYKTIGAQLGISPETVRVHVNMMARNVGDPRTPAYRRVMAWVLAAA